jgi:hypothetical protein
MFTYKSCANQREISVDKVCKYNFHNEGVISTHKNILAYILCVSMVDHQDITPDEMVYLASEFAGNESEQYVIRLSNVILPICRLHAGYPMQSQNYHRVH